MTPVDIGIAILAAGLTLAAYLTRPKHKDPAP